MASKKQQAGPKSWVASRRKWAQMLCAPWIVGKELKNHRYVPNNSDRDVMPGFRRTSCRCCDGKVEKKLGQSGSFGSNAETKKRKFMTATRDQVVPANFTEEEE